MITRATGTMNEITDVRGSRYGQEFTVMLGSPIPDGWIVRRANGNSNVIFYTVGASYGTQLYALVARRYRKAG